jgi:hypothetical protein
MNPDLPLFQQAQEKMSDWKKDPIVIHIKLWQRLMEQAARRIVL